MRNVYVLQNVLACFYALIVVVVERCKQGRRRSISPSEGEETLQRFLRTERHVDSQDANYKMD